MNQKSDAIAGMTELDIKKNQDRQMKDMERDLHREKIQVKIFNPNLI